MYKCKLLALTLTCLVSDSDIPVHNSKHHKPRAGCLPLRVDQVTYCSTENTIKVPDDLKSNGHRRLCTSTGAVMSLPNMILAYATVFVVTVDLSVFFIIIGMPLPTTLRKLTLSRWSKITWLHA